METSTILLRLYKRHLCLYFERGHCEKGLHCTFAHGLDELRDPREDRARPSAAEPEGQLVRAWRWNPRALGQERGYIYIFNIQYISIYI